MRPDMNDILGGIQRTLMEEILPDLNTDRGRERLTSVLFLLQHCMARWDRVGAFLAEEHADLCDLFGGIAAERASGAAAGRLAEILHGIEAAAAPAPGPGAAETLSIEALRESVRERRTAVASLLRELAAMELAPESPLARCRREAYGYAWRQIKRDREWVEVGEIRW